MKKILATILSLSLTVSSFTAAFAAAGELDDGLDNLNLIYSHSTGIENEVHSGALGSYLNPSYAYSSQNEMEFVYNLEKLASFEVTTLNFRNDENIKFYASQTAGGVFEEITDFSKTSENLGSNWSKNTYFAGVENDYNYFKIAITQQRAKYIRLDHVKLMQDLDLELNDEIFYDQENNKISDNNIYAVSSIELKFNQRIENAQLQIQKDNEDYLQPEGVLSEDGSSVIYRFDPLPLGVYDFSAEFETSTGKRYTYHQKKGVAVNSTIGDYIHFEDKLTVSDFLGGLTDAEGKTIQIGEFAVISSDEEVIKIDEGGNIIPQKAGKTTLSTEFSLNGQNVRYEKVVTLCTISEISITPEKFALKPNETKYLKIDATLDDNTSAVPEKITIEIRDKTIAQANGTAIKGLKTGTTYAKVIVEYYGSTFEKNLSVAVGDGETITVPDILTGVEIDLNRTQMYLGEAQYAILKYSSGDNAMNIMAAETEYFSSNESVVDVSADGKLTAKGSGSADIYVKVTLDGISVVSNKINVVVLKNTVDNAFIAFDTSNYRVGDEKILTTLAYDNSGALLERAVVTYSVSGDSFAVSGNKLQAKKQGTSTIEASVTYDGKTVKTNTYTLTAKEYANSEQKIFNTAGDWSGTFEHSDNLIINKNFGAMAKEVDSENVYVTFEVNNLLAGIKADVNITAADYERNPEDFKIYVSKDNVSFERISDEDLTVSQNGKICTYSCIDENEKNLFKNAKYIKLILDAQSGSKQDITLKNFEMNYSVKPEIIGVDTFDISGEASAKNTRKITVAFSQNISSEKLSGVILKNAESSLVETSLTVDGNLLNMYFNTQEDGEYTLFVNGVESTFGLQCDDFSKEINISNEKIAVNSITTSAGSIGAKIINGYENDVTVTVISASYDSNGALNGVAVEKNVILKSGTNNYNSKETINGAANVKIYVWNNMTDMRAY